jgi:hypothetical protein
MGTSPLSRLRKSWESWIDPTALSNKHERLTTYYWNDLSGVLRYMFHWFIVPLEIQDAVVVLRRHLHTLQKWEKLTLQTNTSKNITINDISISVNSYTITFTNIDNHQEVVTFSLQDDQWRGNFITTEIKRNGTSYRSVPFHWDVRNHLYHQHDWYKKEYLNPLASSWLIWEEDIQIIHLFHQIHDVPEMVKWDKHVNDKSWWDAQEESTLIRSIIEESHIKYTPNEIDFTSNSFTVFEQPSNYFKWWERLNYILDAVRSYHSAKDFFHNHTNLTTNILRNQLTYFIDEQKKVWVTPLIWKPKQIPFKELPSAHIFLNTHWKEIQEVLESGSFTDIQPLRDKIITIHQL